MINPRVIVMLYAVEVAVMGYVLNWSWIFIGFNAFAAVAYALSMLIAPPCAHCKGTGEEPPPPPRQRLNGA